MPITNDTVLALNVTLPKLNIILASLAEMPYKVSNDLINEIRSQVTSQLKDDNVQALRPGAD